MQSGLVSLATVLMLATTGCGQLGGVCNEDCSDTASGGTAAAGGSAGSGGAASQPGEVPADVKPIPEGERVVGYLPTWGGKLSSYAKPALLSRLTHVAIAFAEVGPGGLYFTDPNDVRAFVAAAHQFDVKVLVSLGGAAGSDELVAQVAANLPAFVAQTMALVEDHQLDGVDVDIEGGAVNETYEPLVSALSVETQARGLVLSAAVGNWFEHRITPTALGLFDFVSVMAYDECGSWTDACPHSTMELATNQIAFWVNSRGVPVDKMVLGLPFYGYSWGAGGAEVVSYDSILAQFPDAWQTDWIDDGTTQWSYNGKATIAAKVELGKQHGGVMIWDLASDDLQMAQNQLGEHSLLRVVNDSY